MERNRLARQIIDTCLEMTRLGLNQGTAGNVSVRYEGGMLITPTGIPYEKLTESHIVWIDASGQHEQGDARRQSVESINDIDGIRHATDCKCGEYDGDEGESK